MLYGLLASVQASAARTAETAALGLGAGIALLIGLGFWTLAGWLFLISVTTTLNAAVVIASLYTGLGLLIFGILSARARKRRNSAALRETAAAAPAANLGSIAQAFMGGYAAGSATRP